MRAIRLPHNQINMSNKIRFVNTLLFAMLLLAACQPAEKTPQIGIEAEMDGVPYRVVSVAELQTMLEAKDFFMVNVHTPFEGNIPQTDLHLPYDEIAQNLDQLPGKKDAKIVIYCFTSGMAKQAIAILVAQGYTNLWMLDGGTTEWQAAGLTLEK